MSGTLPALLSACIACHGAGGVSTTPNTPSLAAQPQVFLENTLILVREGLRPIASMDGLLKGVSDADIVALSAHFSKVPAPGGGAAPAAVPATPAERDARVERGRQLATQGLCGTCHLPNYAGQQQMPRLAGQRADYLTLTMRQFRDNRAEGRDTQMNGVMRGYSDRDIGDMADYFAQLR